VPTSRRAAHVASLLAEGKIWVKVSGAYRVSTQYPNYADAKAIHEALVCANPEQVILGQRLPHPRLEKDMPRTHLLDLFQFLDATPDCGRKYWWTTRLRLYGF